jgi:hypothetical protein
MMISHLVKANKKSYSFKTTVPRQVIEALKIQEDDALQWKVGEKNGEVYATVKKLAIS